MTKHHAYAARQFVIGVNNGIFLCAGATGAVHQDWLLVFAACVLFTFTGILGTMAILHEEQEHSDPPVKGIG